MELSLGGLRQAFLKIFTLTTIELLILNSAFIQQVRLKTIHKLRIYVAQKSVLDTEDAFYSLG